MDANAVTRATACAKVRRRCCRRCWTHRRRPTTAATATSATPTTTATTTPTLSAIPYVYRVSFLTEFLFLPSFFSYRVSCFTEILSLPSNLFLPIFWCLMPAPSMESIVNETRLAKARAAGRVVLDHAHLKAHLCGCVGVCVCVADVLYEPAAAAERFSALVRRPAVLRRRLRAAPQRPGEAGAGPHRRPPGAVKKAKKKIQPDKKIVFFLPTPTSRSLPTLCNYNRLCATLIGSSFPSAVSSLECSFFVVFFNTGNHYHLYLYMPIVDLISHRGRSPSNHSDRLMTSRCSDNYLCKNDSNESCGGFLSIFIDLYA